MEEAREAMLWVRGAPCRPRRELAGGCRRLARSSVGPAPRQALGAAGCPPHRSAPAVRPAPALPLRPTRGRRPPPGATPFGTGSARVGSMIDDGLAAAKANRAVREFVLCVCGALEQPMADDVGNEFGRLVGIMARLRAEGGCPWDREQDLRSLRPYLLEETHEVLDEMDRVSYGGPWRPLCEELGDLLFQIVFHAQLAKEKGQFDISDVCRSISDKIVNRHPHVFGELQVNSSAEVLANWVKLKAAEKKRRTGAEGSVLDGVPSTAPALLRAE